MIGLPPVPAGLGDLLSLAAEKVGLMVSPIDFRLAGPEIRYARMPFDTVPFNTGPLGFILTRSPLRNTLGSTFCAPRVCPPMVCPLRGSVEEALSPAWSLR